MLKKAEHAEIDPLFNHKLSRKQAAQLLGITTIRLDEMVKEGILVRDGMKFPMLQTVHSHIAFLRRERQANTKAAQTSKAQEARAKEIEARMARDDRRIIDLAEAQSYFDGMVGDFIGSLGSLPARITRDARERQRIEEICDGERLRLSDLFAERAQALRTGLEATEADDEDDA